MQFTYFTSNKTFYQDKDLRDAYLDEEATDFPVLRFHSLSAFDWLGAAFTTRHGGISIGHLASLNLGFHRGDDLSTVKENYTRIAKRLGFPLSSVVLTDQVHGTNIVEVDASHCVGEAFTKKLKYTDGIYTDHTGLVLCASFADCVPIYLVDPVTRRIALVHSGWRGTVDQISAKAVSLLIGSGTRPEDCIAVIGPSISQPNYEVSIDVLDAFRAQFSEETCKDIFYLTDPFHGQLDLWAACYYTLVTAGLSPEHIHFSGLCTHENFMHLFSHRRTNGQRGNLNAFLWLK